ncbi:MULTISPECIES: polysaccharide pyruvyl transferase family protein [Methanosarcina]|uniref:Polysaccharide pyruvyl transferase n=1 Tax=Methanosarcina mazei TaxID=2209 RepID=A0A0F8MN53_METMZ|nr:MULTISPECIES: polysaccharide pyruvyl transferase family protein [Methanosarcina]KKH29920.1 polysaccharide pyruvyl transferase [Methanosarcina mazei]MDY9926368.1 polysaccharide pyruvyl transferase family protein [Methanosarcina sp.]
MSESPTFILAGNGPYDNRGCEAIVRGTVKILRHYYNDPTFLCVSNFKTQEQFERQSREESDPAIVHKKTNKRQSKFDLNWLVRLPLRNMYPKSYKNWIYKEMIPYIENSNFVLSIGGDNYSLDYGIPRSFTYLDDIVLERRKPLIIWGASVGPFEKIPEYERYMKKHLQNITGIFARESTTVEYLERIGVTDNVFRTADPAFLMDASEPKFGNEFEIETDSIGINLSPLMKNYVNNGDLESWIKTAAGIVDQILKKTDSTIYLIPHVTNYDSNDYLFLKEVKERIKTAKEKVILIPPIYDASETKWIISKMKFFAGARTHSTIAALSSGVPTLSFAYSMKANGINKDIFGHNNYCINPRELTLENAIEKFELMTENYTEIKSSLNVSIPKIQKEALSAGEYLQKLIK